MSYRDRAVAVIPGGVNSAQRCVPGLEDLVITGARGATFTDDRGREYVDFHASFGPQLLGHCDPDVDAAVVDTMRRVDLPGVGVTDTEVELAERIVRHVDSIEQVLLTSSGSEATFHALRVARAATGRRYIVKFQGCYHGWHDAVAMNVISAPERVGQRDLLSEGIMPAVAEATIVCRFNDLESVQEALENYDVAAVIVEPIPHNIGALLPREGFLRGLRELCDEHGTVLIFDEVITGFRHGLGGYQAVAGVRPDLTTFGKAFANGYPLGAIGGSADLMARFSSRPGGSVFFAGTYNGHPTIAAAAIATLDKIEREPVHDHIFRLGQRARDELTALYAELGIPAVVSGYGSVFVSYFLDERPVTYEDLLRNDVDLFVGYRRELMRHGVFELPLNLKRSHVSYAHTDAHIDALVAGTRAAVEDVLERGAPSAMTSPAN